MLLYTYPGAVNPARVVFFLAEKGLDVPTRNVDLMAGEHKTPEYRGIAANGRVPALTLDNGTTLCETVAMCRYIEALHPDPVLFGDTPEARAHIEMWDRMMELEVMMPMAMAFRHTLPEMRVMQEQIPAYGEQQRGVAHKRLRRLDREMDGSEYVAGEHFSVADITLWCSLKFFRVAGFEVTADWPNLKAWFGRIKRRPAADVAFR